MTAFDWVVHLGCTHQMPVAVQWGKLFQVFEGLGIRVLHDVPDDVRLQLPADIAATAGAHLFRIGNVD